MYRWPNSYSLWEKKCGTWKISNHVVTWLKNILPSNQYSSPSKTEVHIRDRFSKRNLVFKTGSLHPRVRLSEGRRASFKPCFKLPVPITLYFEPDLTEHGKVTVWLTHCFLPKSLAKGCQSLTNLRSGTHLYNESLSGLLLIAHKLRN